MTRLFFLDQKSDQLAVGLFLLITFIGVMPFLTALLVDVTTRMNVRLFGSLYGGQEIAAAVGKIFFAASCAFFAAYGAILLALAASVSAGLIKSPWE